jgi:DNA repair photolyase
MVTRFSQGKPLILTLTLCHNVTMHYADYKTILSPKNGMNLYRGCTHGCIYCDSRSVCYQMSHDFEDIEVKRDAPRILEDQLRRRRQPCVIGTGAMSDPYIPLEEDLQVTRQCLEIIERYGFGLAIQTKSERILRDLDILQAINTKTKCVVQITMTTYDENLCCLLEPNVSTSARRFQVLEVMRDAGIPTVVWLCPFLPFLNDTEENLRGLLDYCVEAQVKGILFFGFGVTMREGNREYFYQKLDQLFPGMKERYIKAFGSSYECRSPNSPKLMSIMADECSRRKILWGTRKVFDLINHFPEKNEQLTLF